MTSQRDTTLDILRHNLGFADPEQWLDYAIRHYFREIKATPVPDCPDCGASSNKQVGQYVYYSTLIHLKQCGSCRLIWADAHIDPQSVKNHFDSAYKDHDYFVNARKFIFQHLAAEINRVAPGGGKILDVGGAMGHLMHMVKAQRPDIKAVVHDISEVATNYAAEVYNLPVFCGDLATLESHAENYDVVVLSDVLYYEPNLAQFWPLLPQLVEPGGAVIIRVPNKLLLIYAYQVLYRLSGIFLPQRLQDRVRFFNPEHIYILGRKYLIARLKSVGFTSIQVLPSPMLSADIRYKRILKRIYFRIASMLNKLSSQKLVLTPSMIITAKKGTL